MITALMEEKAQVLHLVFVCTPRSLVRPWLSPSWKGSHRSHTIVIPSTLHLKKYLSIHTFIHISKLQLAGIITFLSTGGLLTVVDLIQLSGAYHKNRRNNGSSQASTCANKITINVRTLLLRQARPARCIHMSSPFPSTSIITIAIPKNNTNETGY